MNCNYNLVLLSQMIDAPAKSDETDAILAHLKNCEKCDSAWSDLLNLRERLKKHGNAFSMPSSLSKRIRESISSPPLTPMDTRMTVTGELLRDDIVEVMAGLSPRERDVLRLRFGLDNEKCRTLEEVGELFGVTRERVRQIETKALRKLRHPNRSRRESEAID